MDDDVTLDAIDCIKYLNPDNPEDWARLSKYAHSDEADVRSDATDVLVHTRVFVAEARELAIYATTDDNWCGRISGLEGLTVLEATDELSRIRSLVTNDVANEVRATAIYSLGVIGEDEDLEFLRGHQVRYELEKFERDLAIHKLADKASAKMLLERLDHEDPYIRSKVAHEVRDIVSETNFKIILRSLKTRRKIEDVSFVRKALKQSITFVKLFR